MKRRPKLLDLFCGAGGAATGYARAGFEVVGVDAAPQPRYPFQFCQDDALSLPEDFVAGFDAIHASPPCQRFCPLTKQAGTAEKHPDLIASVREMLRRTGKPYVLENVPGAPLENPIMLCGTMFHGLRVLRHRLFECHGFFILTPPHGRHPRCHTRNKRVSFYGETDEMVDFVSVFGHGQSSVRAARDAMGIHWMTMAELSQAIPPPYTSTIGAALRTFL